MLKHATICRTSKAQQAFMQGQWSQSQPQRQQHLQQQVQDGNSNGNRDEIDEALPSLKSDTWLTSHASRFTSSSCSASPTPSAHLFNDTANSSLTFSSAPSSVFSSPSKHHYNRQTSFHQTPSSNKSANSMIKIFAQTLSQDVEYVTLHVDAHTKSRQIIRSLLKKFRLKHRDPNLFYLTLERLIRKEGLKTKSVMLLGDESCPLQLQQCCSDPPHNDIRFTLQVRAGALMKIHCSEVCPNTRYKCLSLSTQTTVDETIELMLHCLNMHKHSVNDYGTQQMKNSATYDQHTQTAQHNHHHIRQASSPGSSSSAQSTSSSSSGIESDPTNQMAGHRQLNPDSRTSSITSISSSSNISNNSSLTNDSQASSCGVDQYCLVIECKDTNYRRILGPDEFLVDVYQNLLEEAKCEAVEDKMASNNHESSASLPRQFSGVSKNESFDSTNNELIKQRPDQWFVIKLKRRDTISPHHLDLIKTTNPHKQMMPLPPIPQSLSLQLNNANELRHIVSTTQIEVNIRPNSSLALAAPATGASNRLASGSSNQHNGSSFDTPDSCVHKLTAQHSSPSTTDVAEKSTIEHTDPQLIQMAPESSSATCASVGSLVSSNSMPTSGETNPFIDDAQHLYGNTQEIHQHERQMSIICESNRRGAQDTPLPPASLIWLPPVRPRRRNLSNASSTFQRPRVQDGLKMTNSFVSNRRRYDPIQLAKDLNELHLGDSSSSSATTTNDIPTQLS